MERVRNYFTVNQFAIGVIVAVVIAVSVTAIVMSQRKDNNKDGKITEEKLDPADPVDVVAPGDTPAPGSTLPPQLRAGDAITTPSDYQRVDLENTNGITYTFTYARPPTTPASNSTGFYFAKDGGEQSVGFLQSASDNEVKLRTVSGGYNIPTSSLTMPVSGVLQVVVQFQGPTQPPAAEGKEIVKSDFFIDGVFSDSLTGFNLTKQQIFEGLAKITSIQRLNNFNQSEVSVVLT